MWLREEKGVEASRNPWKGVKKMVLGAWGRDRLPEANVSDGMAVQGQGNSSMGDIFNLLTPGSDCVSGIRSHTLIHGGGCSPSLTHEAMLLMHSGLPGRRCS